jgi:hypothetical protein
MTEEVLVDFREIIGEHSGKNLADIVWQIISMYNIQDKVSFWSVSCLVLIDYLSRSLQSHLTMQLTTTP